MKVLCVYALVIMFVNDLCSRYLCSLTGGEPEHCLHYLNLKQIVWLARNAIYFLKFP